MKDGAWQRKMVCDKDGVHACMHACMHAWMNEWMNEWMDEWMNEWMDGWMNEWMYECINVSMYQCMNVWMYECINVSMYQCINVWMYECMNVWMYECMNVCVYVCMWPKPACQHHEYRWMATAGLGTMRNGQAVRADRPSWERTVCPQKVGSAACGLEGLIKPSAGCCFPVSEGFRQGMWFLACCHLSTPSGVLGWLASNLHFL